MDTLNAWFPICQRDNHGNVWRARHTFENGFTFSVQASGGHASDLSLQARERLHATDSDDLHDYAWVEIRVINPNGYPINAVDYPDLQEWLGVQGEAWETVGSVHPIDIPEIMRLIRTF